MRRFPISLKWPVDFLSRSRDTIDAVSKIAGVCLVFFYVAQYSIDIIRTNQDAARSEAIGYINRFSNGDLLQARLALLDFWRARADLAKVGVSGVVPRENFGFILLEELGKAPAVETQLKRVGYFFDELFYCYTSDLCNQDIVKAFFCEHATGYEETYFGFLRQSDAQVIGRDLYTGVQELSAICLTPEP